MVVPQINAVIGFMLRIAPTKGMKGVGNMVGITSYGAYIPWHRLSRETIGKIWGGGGKGEKAVAYFDEDSITMVVSAAKDCLTGKDPKTIDGLYLASTTSPYKEKQAAATVATAIDLRRDIITMDFGSSLRGGAAAMIAAMDAVSSSPNKTIMVCAADARLGAPSGAKERDFGDGAAALLVGDTGVIATIEDTYSTCDEIIDVWRSDKDTFVNSWEDRFVKDKGYSAVVIETVGEALARFKIRSEDISKFVCYTPTGRDINEVARKLGFDIKTQIQDPLYDTVGNTGIALTMMVLVGALEEARAGDQILFVSYGDGCTVILLRVTEEIEKVGKRRGIKGHLATKAVLTNYERYLRWREIIPLEPPARPLLEQPSAAALWRDRKSGLALYGSKCKQCGSVQYPVQRVCVSCRAKDQFEYYPFADKKGIVVTFSQDTLAVTMDPPTTICAIDFAGGGRILCDMTDRDPKEVQVGMPVEMTFRLLRKVGGISDYWWKCKPVRS
jgi:hydroxymethylglutaryl-CoA synthase